MRAAPAGAPRRPGGHPLEPRAALLNVLGRLAKKYGLPSPVPAGRGRGGAAPAGTSGGATMADVGTFVSDVAKAKPPQQQGT